MKLMILLPAIHMQVLTLLVKIVSKTKMSKYPELLKLLNT